MSAAGSRGVFGCWLLDECSPRLARLEEPWKKAFWIPGEARCLREHAFRLLQCESSDFRSFGCAGGQGKAGVLFKRARGCVRLN
jgi:hypothetical protein